MHGLELQISLRMYFELNKKRPALMGVGVRAAGMVRCIDVVARRGRPADRLYWRDPRDLADPTPACSGTLRTSSLAPLCTTACFFRSREDVRLLLLLSLHLMFAK